MITIQITHGDAIKSLMRKLGHPIEFTEPLLTQFYEDEARGLCTVKIEHSSINARHMDRVIDLAHVEYFEPENEMLRKLGACLV